MTETVNVPPANTGPTLEEEAAAQEAEAAAAKGEEPKLAGEENTPERPEWLPEKFKTPEDLAKAYAELEKDKSKPKPQTEEEAQETATKAVENAGLDMDALNKEFADTGELSKESMEALAKVGISEDMVQSYIDGQTAKADAARASLLEPVGGEDGYNEMVTWAADNLSEAEIDAFNSVLDSGDAAAMKMAVENLNTKFVAANGSEPNRELNGKGVTGSSVYESTADLLKDMNNPEYAKNPAFRAKVEAKLGRSNIM